MSLPTRSTFSPLLNLRALVAVLAAALIALAGLATFAGSVQAAPGDVVNIPDPNLKALLNSTINPSRAPDQDITEADAALPTAVSGTRGPIADLTGLEAFINLKMISITGDGNTYSDLGPVSNLTGVTSLNLPSAQISDLSPLANLTDLAGLFLQENRISDFSTMPNLPNLTNLHLTYNEIVDVSSLPSKVDKNKLEILNLSDNLIVDASPLAQLGTDGGKLGQWTTASNGLIVRNNRIADFSAFTAWNKPPSLNHVRYQSIYVGTYRTGGIDVTLESPNGAAPTVNPSTVGTYDADANKLTLTGSDPVDSVKVLPFDWTVFFSSAPEVDDPTLPVISGSPMTWLNLTVSDPGTWFGDEPCDLAYQWLNDGQPVGVNKGISGGGPATVGSGGNAATYMVQPRDIGHRISVRVSCAGTPVASRSLETEVATPSEPESPVIQALDGRMIRSGSNIVLSDSRSGVVDDPTNPKIPIYVAQLDADGELIDPSELDVSVTSLGTNYTRTFEPGDIVVEGTGSERHISLSPRNAGGSSSIVVTVTGPNDKSQNFYFTYLSSEKTTPTSRVHLGTSDQSTSIAVGDGYLLIADDEKQPIRLYDANRSGREVAQFPPSSEFYSGEIDYESSARKGDRVFWLGSHGNNKDGDVQPSRHAVFETILTGTGANAKLVPTGTPYKNLRVDLVDWDTENGNRFGLAAATADGKHPDAIDGFNIEGAEFSPDGSELYLGFRSPVVPATEGGEALIVPVENISELTQGTATEAEFGEPILLDLGGQSIREIRKNDAGEYLIVGGIADGSHFADTQSLWVWDGDPETAPMKIVDSLPPSIPASTTDSGSWEGIGEMPASLELGAKVRLLMDQGYARLYPGTENKDDQNDFTRKSRSEEIVLGRPVDPMIDITGPGVFPDQPANTIGAPRAITVTNTGWSQLNQLSIGKIGLVDEDGESLDDFLTSRNTCENSELDLGDSCTIRIRFAPSRIDTTSNARLAISINDLVSDVSLTGTSTALPKGEDGSDGSGGSDGQDGSDGSDGQPGAPGEKGDPGTDGVDGQSGSNGATGPIGPQGPRGAAGRNGTIRFGPVSVTKRVRRGRATTMRVRVSNNTAATMKRFSVKVRVPRALSVTGRRSWKGMSLRAGKSRTLRVRLRARRNAKLGKHKVRLDLKAGGRKVKRMLRVRVTR